MANDLYPRPGTLGSSTLPRIDYYDEEDRLLREKRKAGPVSFLARVAFARGPRLADRRPSRLAILHGAISWGLMDG